MSAETRAKLLIVEDDEGLQRQLRWAYDDYEVLVASDRGAAVDLLRSQEPPVVTLDLGLPPDPNGVSEGFATLETILSLKPDTKVRSEEHTSELQPLKSTAYAVFCFRKQ